MTNKGDNTAFLTILLQVNSLKTAGNYLAAAKLYEEGVAIVGEHSELYAAIAYCYFAASLLEKDEKALRYGESALQWMEQAVALAPLNGRFHANLAQYYSLLNLDYESAATEYRKAISLAPNDIQALVGTASLYGVPEQIVSLDEATTCLERAVSLEPEDPNFRLRLGDLYHEGGRANDALREWSHALLCPRPVSPRSTAVIEAAVEKNDE